MGQMKKSLILKAWRKNKKLYGKNPQCDYCSFFSSSKNSRPSKSFPGLRLCSSCAGQERFIDLKDDTRTRSPRCRALYPWTPPNAKKRRKKKKRKSKLKKVKHKKKKIETIEE